MLCPFAVHRIIPSSTDPKIEAIGAVLHVDAGNAYSLYNWFKSPASQGIESHFHVSRDGRIEQYRDTGQEADANYKGNSFIRNGVRVGFVSIETQGYASGEWTAAQLASIKRLLTWLDETHPRFELRECPGPFDPGVGYHSQWGSPGAWTPAAGKTCPGPDRIRQYRNVIVPWMEEDMALTRNTELDSGSDTLKEDMALLRELGVLTEHSKPGQVLVIDRFAAFLNRYTSRVVDVRIKRAIAKAAVGGASAATVINQIIERLGNG